MAFKKVQAVQAGERNELTWKFDDSMHKVFDGIYRSSNPVKKQDGTTTTMHNFYTADEKKTTVGIWGKSVLDANIPQIFKEGDKVRITYVGKAKSNTPGRFYDNFEFEVDEPENGADRPF